MKFAVSLTGMGSEVSGDTGHFQPFYILDQILNRLRDINLMHLQGGWFMEGLFQWIDSIALHDRIAWSLDSNVKTPWVAVQDVADFAAQQFDTPTEQHRSVKQLGVDYTMSEIAVIVSRTLGRKVDYRFIDRSDREVETVFRERFGSLGRWVYNNDTLAALNDRRVKFHDDRPALRTTMEAFAGDILKSLIEKARTEGSKQETFQTWSAQRS